MDEKYKIHAFYILAILLSVIVILVTVKWANIPGLRDYITFALTVFSMGLAFLAIIYSIYSNSTLTSNLGLLEASTHKLSETSNELSKSTISLSTKVEAIPEALKGVESKIAATHDIISNLETSSKKREGFNDEAVELQDELVDSYLRRSSFNGLLVIYLIALSYKEKKPVKLDEDTFEKFGVTSDYGFSYFVSSEALGIYKTKYNDNAHVCVEFNRRALEKLENAIIDKANEISKPHGDAEHFRNELLENKKSVERYYGLA